MRTLNHISYIVIFVALSLFAISCNKDEIEISTEQPDVSFEGTEAGIYIVKIGKTINITPVISNAQNPKYSWEIDGKVVSRELSYTFSSTEVGKHYIIFSLKALNGNIQEEIRIDVMDKTPPIISFAVPQEGYLTAITEDKLEIITQVKFSKEATYKWVLNSKEVSTAHLYVFNEKELGKYKLELTVSNPDGETTKSVIIKVVAKPTIQIQFPQADVNLSLGRVAVLAPIILYGGNETKYIWEVNGIEQVGEIKETFNFTPNQKGTYIITIVAIDANATEKQIITVKCVAEEGTYYRQATISSSSDFNKVYQFTAAPGQFINKNYDVNTPEEANIYAEKRLKDKAYVSLGGFGGYIVVGFDHSIDNIAGKPDFEIIGNSFAESSEPGVVWVMQDENGNGLPDDTWYELKGSEYGKQETKQNYSITYYRPSSSEMDVPWKDNFGNSGYIKYLKMYHDQAYYYPNWIKANSYTLYGTCLGLGSKENTETGFWSNPSCAWGYADNFGSDRQSEENAGADNNANYFEISNAIYSNGNPVHLKYIDFIKVQTGVNGISGGLGEISTEISGFKNITLNK